MPPVAEALNLRSIGLDALGRDIQLSPAAAAAWTEMFHTATQEGVRLLPISGFRSIARQAEIIRRKLKTGSALDDILRVSAYPGHSEHHAGTALDIGSPHAVHLSEAFSLTPEFNWLVAHAGRFGFALSYPPDNDHGIAYEPWHWNHRAPEPG